MTPADLEQFLMKHGEGITDCQGAEIDRIEQALKVSVTMLDTPCET